MTRHRIFTTSFASVHPHYVAKAEKKGRTRVEVDEIICWLTGYSPSNWQPGWKTGRISRHSSPKLRA